jgi:hypothetical protein
MLCAFCVVLSARSQPSDDDAAVLHEARLARHAAEERVAALQAELAQTRQRLALSRP